MNNHRVLPRDEKGFQISEFISDGDFPFYCVRSLTQENVAKLNENEAAGKMASLVKAIKRVLADSGYQKFGDDVSHAFYEMPEKDQQAVINFLDEHVPQWRGITPQARSEINKES